MHMLHRDTLQQRQQKNPSQGWCSEIGSSSNAQAELDRLKRQHAEREAQRQAERVAAGAAVSFSAPAAAPSPAQGPPQMTEELRRTLKV